MRTMNERALNEYRSLENGSVRRFWNVLQATAPSGDPEKSDAYYLDHPHSMTANLDGFSGWTDEQKFEFFEDIVTKPTPEEQNLVNGFNSKNMEYDYKDARYSVDKFGNQVESTDRKEPKKPNPTGYHGSLDQRQQQHTQDLCNVNPKRRKTLTSLYEKLLPEDYQ